MVDKKKKPMRKAGAMGGKAVNSFRGNLSVEEFKWWCKKVTDHG